MHNSQFERSVSQISVIGQCFHIYSVSWRNPDNQNIDIRGIPTELPLLLFSHWFCMEWGEDPRRSHKCRRKRESSFHRRGRGGWGVSCYSHRLQAAVQCNTNKQHTPTGNMRICHYCYYTVIDFNRYLLKNRTPGESEWAYVWAETHNGIQLRVAVECCDID